MEPSLVVLLVAVIVLAATGLTLWWRSSVRRKADRTMARPTSSSPLGLAAGSGAPASADAGAGQGVDAGASEVESGATSGPSEERDVPEPPAGRLARLRGRLARSGSPLGKALLTILSRDRLAEEDWDDLEEALLLADVGVDATAELLEALRTRLRVSGGEAPDARGVLREQLLEALEIGISRDIAAAGTGGMPGVILVVGVNGSGKTTTIGRLARLLVAQDRTVVLGAADTFRAAGADQLATWAERVGVPVVRGREGSDPASVAFEAVRHGIEDQVGTVIVDTAGRLHNKTNLMDELAKLHRVAAKLAPITEVLLVLDATTGQNGLTQASVFAEAVGVTGIVLTKLDGSAKGGIVIAVQRALGVPVKLVGLGEGADDLALFDPEVFVDGVTGGLR